ncbi:MAG: hypothetical protein ABFD91_09495 [Anaerohalosphaeraceae bacterium]
MITFEIEMMGKSRAKVKVLAGNQTIEVDSFNLDTRKSRVGFLDSVSKKTGIDIEELDRVFLDHIDRLKTVTQPESVSNPLDNCPAHIREQAMDMLKSPELFDIINRDIEAVGIAGEKDLCRQLYIIMTSRILNKPLSGIVFGASASGKTYMIETVSKLMPQESVLQAHDITDEALYYLEPGALEHRIVIAGERIEDKNNKRGKAEDNTKALREMLASGNLSKLVTTKNKDGKPVADYIKQTGPIVYLESTTSTGIHDEDATRLLPLVTDESSQQTKIILNAMCDKAMGQTGSDKLKESIILKHQTAQRVLKSVRVIIPYVHSLNLPYEVVSTRRAFDQLLSMIKAVAILRQYQKEVIDENGLLTIRADDRDYEIVYPLIMRIFARTYSPMNEKSRDLLRVIMDRNTSERFTVQDLTGWAGISDASTRRRLRELIERGIIAEHGESKPYTYSVQNPDLAQTANINLPTPDDIRERLAIMES